MTCFASRFMPIIGLLLCVGCPPSQIAKGLTDLQLLDNLCATDYTANVKAGPGGPQTDVVEFMAVLGNPSSEDAKGSVRILMGVDGSNISNAGNPQHISAQSQVPSFETPVSTVYPANTPHAYTSPVLVTMPYDPNGEYAVEIHKWLVGMDTWDATPCHSFKSSGKKIPRT